MCTVCKKNSPGEHADPQQTREEDDGDQEGDRSHMNTRAAGTEGEQVLLDGRMQWMDWGVVV